jgi:GDP-D-mannose dehydratase
VVETKSVNHEAREESPQMITRKITKNVIQEFFFVDLRLAFVS